MPLGGPGGAAPVLMRNAVRQSASGYKHGLLPALMFISHTHTPLFILLLLPINSDRWISVSDFDQNIKLLPYAAAKCSCVFSSILGLSVLLIILLFVLANLAFFLFFFRIFGNRLPLCLRASKER